MFRILLVFVRRLWLPLVVFALFSLMCVLVYRRLEGLIWQDALFWMIQPHAIDAKRVHNSTKLFSIFVYCGVFGFQIWWRSGWRLRSLTGREWRPGELW